MTGIPGLSFTTTRQQAVQSSSASLSSSVQASPVISLNLGAGSAPATGPGGGVTSSAPSSPTATGSQPGDHFDVPLMAPLSDTFGLGLPTRGRLPEYVNPTFATANRGAGTAPRVDNISDVPGGGLGDLFKDPIVVLALAGAAALFLFGSK